MESKPANRRDVLRRNARNGYPTFGASGQHHSTAAGYVDEDALDVHEHAALGDLGSAGSGMVPSIRSRRKQSAKLHNRLNQFKKNTHSG